MKTKLLGLLAGIGIYALGAQPAAAVSITSNATGSGADGPLSASAAFTTSAGLLSVAITNLLSPTQIVSAGQTVSALSFTLSNAPANLGLPSSSSFPNANSSITGGQFNPFVVATATFSLALSEITAATTITQATFSFGTRPDIFIMAPGPIVGAGLPALVAACVGLLALARRRRKLVVT
jgi:hypothetical protein